MQAAIAIILAALAVQTGRRGEVFVDPRDSARYPVVEIAGMAWMGRNLVFGADGSSCPRGEAPACAAEGRLYPWKIAAAVCPAGWHLATEEEWRRLERFLGMSEAEVSADRLRGPGTGDRLKDGGSTGLDFPLAGWRRPDGTYAVGNGNDRAAAIWTATPANDTQAWHRDLSSARSGIWRSPVTFDYSLSVRCVRDAKS
jgi:uncharacterized protein (TIGR02145 family)